MRPERLEVEGFTAFRERAVVDFEGADLFAFVGPTGSGKSSLVDAILFALYGVVPRLGKATVEPVISLGRNEARVRFDFTVGRQSFTAARVVRRTKGGGATTAEARLEGGPDVIMGADEVTEAVEGVLGLGFDHFTKCVVLPQGQFAAFLQDPAAKRQELLRQLLDLGRYRRVRDLAVARQRAADNRFEVLDQQISQLAFATDDALKVTTGRRDRLAKLVLKVEESESKSEAIAAEMARASEQARQAQEHAQLIRAIAKPANLARLSTAAEEAVAALEAALEADNEAAQRVSSVEKAAAAMTDGGVLERLAEQRSRLATETLAEGQAMVAVEQAAGATEQAARKAREKEASAVRAVGALDAARREHAAHTLAVHLEEGEPCPVCRRTVEELPLGDDMPPELPALENEADKAQDESKESTTAQTAHSERLAAARSRHDELVKRVKELTEVLSGQPGADEIGKLLEERRQIDRSVAEARAATGLTRRQMDAAQKALAQINLDIQQARREFDRSRDQVAVLNPPPAKRDDLEADWNALAKWAQSTEMELSTSVETLNLSVAAAGQQLAQIEKELINKLEVVGVDFDQHRPQRLRDLCADALAAAKQEVTRLEGARAKTIELAEQRTAYGEAGTVAKTLARHLAANGFEGWLMAEALEALIEGANHRLDDLSGGAFSLELDKRDFLIVDHRNADERRSVKTLSGGETFLVSLALALALAEQLASMSVHGVARLESIFLDEGFGTLDAETLDVVATVIHELGSDGRTIGLITHVKDLAEQVPVRFEVRKGPGGATVKRVEA